MPVTSLDLVKRALAESGTRTTITSLTDGSPEATYANLLYEPLRNFLLREGDYDFAMKRAAAAASAEAALTPWVFSYVYPTDCIRIRQVIPTVYTALDPTPVEWDVFNNGTDLRVVSKIAISAFLYTFSPGEDDMDFIFQEALVRLLGSALTMALESKIEPSKKALEEAMMFAGIADLRTQ